MLYIMLRQFLKNFLGDEILETVIHCVKHSHFLPTGEQYFISMEHGYKVLSLTDTDLQHLNYNEIWDNCREIELVNLLHNKLQSLCPSLQSHSSTLLTATLSYNNFDDIPDVLFSLHELQNLNMIYNSVSVIPQSISSLTNLTHLYLSHNNIFSLPDSFTACKSLNTLCLDNNHLSNIPSSIQKLQSLLTLELHHNCLQYFQVFEGGFKYLKYLSLHFNRLQVLPEAFQQLLNQLETCTLRCNPFPDPQFCKQLCHLEIENKTCTKNREISKKCIKFIPKRSFRTVVLGGCGSGKTSIIQVLCKDKYVTPVEKHEHNHTIGIEQHVHHFESHGSLYELSVWDFAGEDSYSMMNYMFLSEGTLIWLVFNLDQFEDNPKSYQEMIGIWLRGVVACVKNPSVWIIGTHADLCSEQELIRKENAIYSFVAEEYESLKCVMEPGLVSEVTSSIANDEVSLSSASVKVFTVSNTFARFGYDKLCNEIKKIPSSKMSKLYSNLPPKWQHVYIHLKERSAETLVEDYSKVVDVLCREEFASEKPDAEDILDYLHKSGDILILPVNWKSECQVKKIIFLDVMQLINILKQIFRHDLHKKVADKLKISRDYNTRSQEDALTLVCEHGIISEDILTKLWSPLSISKTDMHLLIDLLERFKMAYQVTRGGEVCYLFPFLLKPSSLSDRPSTHIKHITIHCEFGFIPCGLFEKLLCCTLPYFAPDYKIHRNKLEGIACIKRSLNLKLLISCIRNPTTNYDGLIEIHVEEMDNSNNNMQVDYSALWELAINVIRELKELISELHKLRVSLVVLCPLCTEEKHYFPLAFPPTSNSSIDIKCKCSDLKEEAVIPPISK